MLSQDHDGPMSHCCSTLVTPLLSHPDPLFRQSSGIKPGLSRKPSVRRFSSTSGIISTGGGGSRGGRGGVAAAAMRPLHEMHWRSKHVPHNSTTDIFCVCNQEAPSQATAQSAQRQALQQHIRGWINRRWRVNRGRRWGWQRGWWRICGRVIWWPVGGIPRASADAACKQCHSPPWKGSGRAKPGICVAICHDDSATSVPNERAPSLKSQQAAVTLPSSSD